MSHDGLLFQNDDDQNFRNFHEPVFVAGNATYKSLCLSVGRLFGHTFTFSMRTALTAPALLITAPAHLITAPA